MSPALKRTKFEDAPPVKRRLRTAAADATPRRSEPREQQEAIERAYGEYEPHVPSLPGGVKVAILASGVAASWLAIIALVKAVAG